MPSTTQQNHVIALPFFNDIDRRFADYIISQEPADSTSELYTATLCLSYYANQQHSVLPLDNILLEGKTNEGEALSHQVPPFTDYKDWPQRYSHTIGLADDDKPLILDPENGLLYLNKYYRAEASVADYINNMSSTALSLSTELINQLNDLLPDKTVIDSDNNLEIINWQKVAAFAALRSRFCVISGGPGTGKTTTVGNILALLISQDPDVKINLVAPTGKAADRLGQSIKNTLIELGEKTNIAESILKKIPQTAETIHRYLGFNPGGGFKHNQKNKCSSNILLIDESSMVPLVLFRAVLNALRDDCRVILLGDKDQLAAVETGNVLGDLTSGDKINSFSQQFCSDYQALTKGIQLELSERESPLQDVMVKLEHSWRFKDDSGIGHLAKDVNEAPNPHPLEDSSYFEKYEDICHLALPTKIESILDKTLKKFFDEYLAILRTKEVSTILAKLNEARILCAGRSGNYGSEALNTFISKKIFNQNDEALYHGRALMITRNDNSLKLYNGDIGVVLITNDLPKVYFLGDNNTIREFPPSVLPDYESSFAMTIHKSQGSEYNKVYLVLSDKSERLLSKELFYTGITRAKEYVEIYADHKELLNACKKITQRFSGLLKRLK
ncbi:exodeoxyribonuclease V subunit alpha [Lentisphaera profundi]|uniref:Exodeoxyribonuclease V subunit alpha n=1 Tax=Lentisphaera profundi TaxID=1658616 RepID=A0ABY7VSG7_9BACT|nr:exodeoxyribonuclease V subunit alpha [Lentisphaera profundi]WDE97143.1 exodeoxyribonuclease V subunit alpha [Lentisphaera profundi]